MNFNTIIFEKCSNRNTQTGNYESLWLGYQSDGTNGTPCLTIQEKLTLQSNQNKDIRVASVFTLVNLTWRYEEGAKQRVQQLSRMGCLEKLHLLLNDPDLEVRDRVRQAIDNFKSTVNDQE